jgi:NAD(P)-dependent dehydrogenase (short-subunit alcohol dehydrogenase family)
MDELFCIKDKAVVITGGAGILCSAVAKYLARQGAKVCIVDYDKPGTDQLVKQIESEGGFAIPACANVLDNKEITQACSFAVKNMGRVDVLINGAGGNKKEATVSDELSFFDLSADAIRWVLDLNLTGTILSSQVFAKHMAERGEGIILNVSSMSAFRALTKVGAYSAAKAAVSNFTQWLAVHMCRNYSAKIRVNAIAPGFFLTNQNRFLLMKKQVN